MLPLLALTATVAASGCPSTDPPALALYARDRALAWALVPEGSPLLGEALPSEASVILFPLVGVRTATGAHAAWVRGKLSCEAPREVPVRALRSPVDGSALGALAPLPVLAPVRGVTDPGSPCEARIAELADLVTHKDYRVPVRPGAARRLPVPGGTALAVPLESAAIGPARMLYGPVIRLGALPAGDANANPCDRFGCCERPGNSNRPAGEANAPPCDRVEGCGRAGSSDRPVGEANVNPCGRIEGCGATADRPSLEEAGTGAPAGARCSAERAPKGAELRERLDAREGMLVPGDRVAASLPGLGAIDRTAGWAALPHDPGDELERFGVAHGLAFGLPALSIAVSLIGSRRCVVLCTSQVLPGDRSFLATFTARTPASIAEDRTRMNVFDGATLGVAALTVLIPTGRRGRLSRVEALEDLLVIGEAVLVGATTPYFLEARIARARPVSFHTEARSAVSEEDLIGPVLASHRSSRAGALFGSVLTQLVVEEADWRWVIGGSIVVGGLGLTTAVFEVRSGTAFPTDIPLGFLSGALAGAGTVLWHQVFWRGWPTDDRGALPLRIRGFGITPAPGGASVSASAVF